MRKLQNKTITNIMAYRIFNKPYINTGTSVLNRLWCPLGMDFCVCLLFIPQGICPKLRTRKNVHIFASLRIVKNLLYVKSFIPKLFQSVGSSSIFLVHFWLIFNKGILYFFTTLLIT